MSLLIYAYVHVNRLSFLDNQVCLTRPITPPITIFILMSIVIDTHSSFKHTSSYVNDNAKDKPRVLLPIGCICSIFSMLYLK